MTEEIVKKITKEEYEELKNQAFYDRKADEYFYKTTWVRRFWRPAMAWLYAVIILFDFLIFPGIFVNNGGSAWSPLTLQGNGMFHVAMGGILTAAAWTRGAYEKPYEMGYGNAYYNDYGGNNTMRMQPYDNYGDALSRNEDEIIPPTNTR